MRLFIRVDDYGQFNFTTNDHVNDIYVTITLTPNSSFTSTRAYNSVNGMSTIELSFRLQCTSNFYGSDCTTYCVARDDIEGHFDCGPDGEKICLSGWSDPSRNCTILCKLYMQTIVHGAAANQWLVTVYRHMQMGNAYVIHLFNKGHLFAVVLTTGLNLSTSHDNAGSNIISQAPFHFLSLLVY